MNFQELMMKAIIENDIQMITFIWNAIDCYVFDTWSEDDIEALSDDILSDIEEQFGGK